MLTSKATRQSESERPVNRLLKILANLSEELESFEANVESQIQDAVSDTETRLEALATEQQQLAVRETEASIRNQVTKDLLDRFAVEFEVSKAEFEQRRNEEYERFKADPVRGAR